MDFMDFATFSQQKRTYQKKQPLPEFTQLMEEAVLN
jgi:hypothetical protein